MHIVYSIEGGTVDLVVDSVHGKLHLDPYSCKPSILRQGVVCLDGQDFHELECLVHYRTGDGTEQTMQGILCPELAEAILRAMDLWDYWVVNSPDKRFIHPRFLP